MLTWSAKIYLTIIIIFTIILSILSFIGTVNSEYILKQLSDNIIVFSIALIVFPTVAVPLMLQIIVYTKEYIDETPTKGLYRDFNVACLTVSMGAIAEIITIFIVNISENNMINKILSSFALSNLIAFTFMFVLIMLFLHKIIIELELFLAR